MNTTVRIKASQIYKDWHVIDAADRPLGRVATEAATLLRGKHKPTFEPHLDGGDFVIIVNASKVRVTGRKEHQIKYYTHSGYPGGLRVRSYADQLARFPDRIIQQAVWGMLPGGALGKKMLRHLKVYAGPDHPHASQIASTQKAQAERTEAQDALKNTALKAPRLRPLSVPQVESAAEETPVAAPAAPERKARPSRGKAPRAAAVATTAAELEAAAATVLTTETTPPAEALLNEETVVAENATPAEAAIEQGEPIAEAKPRRTRKAAAPDADAESAPRPRARKKATADESAEAPAAEKKPTTRRRSAPKTKE